MNASEWERAKIMRAAAECEACLRIAHNEARSNVNESARWLEHAARWSEAAFTASAKLREVTP